MARIKVILDDSALQAQAGKLSRGTADLSPFFQQLATRLYQEIDRKFRAQGPGWKPRAQSSKKRRERIGKDPNGPLLQMNGKLRQSITGKGGPASIQEIASNSLTIGSNMPYANIQNYGGTIVQKRREMFGKSLKNPVEVSIGIPARPFIPTEAELEPIIAELWADYLEDLQ